MESKTLSPSRRLYDRGLRALLYLCGFLTCALLVLIIGYIFFRGIPHISLSLLTTESSYINDTIGILPNILNTIYLVALAMVIVLPLGVGAAIYLTEYATNRKLVSMIEFATETLTGIPSIIFGLVGMLFFIQLVGWQTGVLAGGLTLVVMILPTIVRTTQESLKTVPQCHRRHRHRLHPGRGPHRGRVRRSAVHRRFRSGAQRLLHLSGVLLRQPDRSSVRLCQRAWRDRRGLRHRHHPDGADPGHQPVRQPGGQKAEEISSAPARWAETEETNIWIGRIKLCPPSLKPRI